MKLLTQALRNQLPPLYSQENKGGKAMVWMKCFLPASKWRWYITEASSEGEDVIFFGLVDGFEKELGYFTLSELKGLRGPLGLRVERDLYWRPQPLEEVAPELFAEQDETSHTEQNPVQREEGR